MKSNFAFQPPAGHPMLARFASLPLVSSLVVSLLSVAVVQGADWPMARHDARRSGSGVEELAEDLHPQWRRSLPPLVPAWPDQPKMQFDRAYDPVVVGRTLYLASSRHDWVAAFDTRTGKETWRYFAEGPVRFAPLVHRDRIYFTSDDGHLYCLKAADGSLVWKFRGGPADRPILGNERLVSSWPARGAPVAAGNTVYFAAGIWPFMGIFVHAVDARTGKAVWTNDGEGVNYIRQPHNTDSFATVAPQGHLVVAGDHLLLPGGRSIPALFDRRSGKLVRYQLAENGKKGGGAEVAVLDGLMFNGGAAFDAKTQKHLGELGDPIVPSADGIAAWSSSSVKLYDPEKAGEQEIETVDRRGKKTKTRRWSMPVVAAFKTARPADLIRSGNRWYAAVGKDVLALARDGKDLVVAWKTSLAETPVRLAAADGRLFVATLEGSVHCFGPEKTEPLTHGLPNPVEEGTKEPYARAEALLKTAAVREGYAVVWGAGNGDLAEGLVRHSVLRVVVVEPDAEKVRALRERIVAANLPRLAVLHRDFSAVSLPPYFASLMVAEEEAAQAALARDPNRFWKPLRPFGGKVVFPEGRSATTLAAALEARKAVGLKADASSGFVVLRKEGPLPGTADWTHEHADAANTRVSKDQHVKAPLGVLWFGGPGNEGILPRHGHGPQPQVIDGRLIIEGVHLMRALDIYTGRLLWETKMPGVGRFYDNLAHQAGANASGSNFVSTADGIYVAYGRSCWQLDPATGKKTAEFVLPLEKGETKPSLWGTLNVQGDFLVAAVDPIFDPKLLPDTKGTGDDPEPGTKKKETDLLTKAMRLLRNFGDNLSASKRLVVLDRKTGKVLWSAQARAWFRHNSIILGGGRLYAIDRLSGSQESAFKRRGEETPFPPRIVAFDLATGKLLWSRDREVFGTWLSLSEQHDILVESGRVARDTLPDEPKGMRAFAAGSGETLWFRKEYVGPAMIHGDTILQGQGACDLRTGAPKMRTDPLTGQPSPWTWIRNYGCNTPAASTHLLTFRSGAAGFYDLCGDGGTGNLGGFRSSCTNNLIVAGGVLTAPDYTRTCTCAYQNQTSVGFIHMPEAELWTTFGTKRVEGPIRRLGLNLAAPGDRRTDDGTLWLEYPFVGGLTPPVKVVMEPAKPGQFRRHASGVEGDLSWVAASGVRGLSTLKVTLDPDAEEETRCTVRLHFVEPENLLPGRRAFHVEIQGAIVQRGLDIVREAGGPWRALVKEYRGVRVRDELVVRFRPAPGSESPEPILCGLEIVAEEAR